MIGPAPEPVAAPVLMGFLTGVSILGGFITTIGALFIRKYLKMGEEKEKLKEKAIHSDIESATSTLAIKFEGLRGDFKALEVKMESTLKDFKRLSVDQHGRFDSAVNAMREIVRKAEGRFEIFQQELKDTRFLVERFRKKP